MSLVHVYILKQLFLCKGQTSSFISLVGPPEWNWLCAQQFFTTAVSLLSGTVFARLPSVCSASLCGIFPSLLSSCKCLHKWLSMPTFHSCGELLSNANVASDIMFAGKSSHARPSDCMEGCINKHWDGWMDGKKFICDGFLYLLWTAIFK